MELSCPMDLAVKQNWNMYVEKSSENSRKNSKTCKKCFRKICERLMFRKLSVKISRQPWENDFGQISWKRFVGKLSANSPWIFRIFSFFHVINYLSTRIARVVPWKPAVFLRKTLKQQRNEDEVRIKCSTTRQSRITFIRFHALQRTSDAMNGGYKKTH